MGDGMGRVGETGYDLGGPTLISIARMPNGAPDEGTHDAIRTCTTLQVVSLGGKEVKITWHLFGPRRLGPHVDRARGWDGATPLSRHCIVVLVLHNFSCVHAGPPPPLHLCHGLGKQTEGMGKLFNKNIIINVYHFNYISAVCKLG